MAYITGFVSKSYVQSVGLKGIAPEYIAPMENFQARDTDVPKGVFVYLQGDKYFPTVHGMAPNTRRQMGIVSVGGDMEKAMTIELDQCKQYVLVNTGHQPLRVGDEFIVEYPQQEDSEAQLKVLNNNTAKRMCSEKAFKRAEKLWGGLLATRKLEKDVTTEILHKLTRDAKVIHSTNLLVALSELSVNVPALPATTTRILGQVNAALSGGGAMPDAATVTNAFTADAMELVTKIMASCNLLLNSSNFLTVGRCLGSTLANPIHTFKDLTWGRDGDSVPTGICFKAIMSQFSGL